MLRILLLACFLFGSVPARAGEAPLVLAAVWGCDYSPTSYDAPANTTATVYVPSSEGGAVLEDGKPAEKAAGLRFVKREKGCAVFDAGSGSYTFTGTVAK